MAEQLYPVLAEIRHSGKYYNPPEDSLWLSEEEAAPLLALGALGSPVPQPEDSAPAVEEVAVPPAQGGIPPLAETESSTEAESLPPAGPAKVNLNTATRAMLEALDEVGPATAKKLLAGRPFASIEAAQSASGMPAEQWAKIADLVEV